MTNVVTLHDQDWEMENGKFLHKDHDHFAFHFLPAKGVIDHLYGDCPLDQDEIGPQIKELDKLADFAQSMMDTLASLPLSAARNDAPSAFIEMIDAALNAAYQLGKQSK